MIDVYLFYIQTLSGFGFDFGFALALAEVGKCRPSKDVARLISIFNPTNITIHIYNFDRQIKR